jgi:hypothetical protein
LKTRPWFKGTKAYQFARWFALETVKGGLLTDFDVLPGNFNPSTIKRDTAIQSFAAKDEPSLSAAQFTAKTSHDFVSAILAYDEKSSVPVTDRMIFDATMNDPVNEDRKPLVTLFGNSEWKNSPLVHFSAAAVRKFGKGYTRAANMELYLQGAL